MIDLASNPLQKTGPQESVCGSSYVFGSNQRVFGGVASAHRFPSPNAPSNLSGGYNPSNEIIVYDQSQILDTFRKI